MIKSPDAKSGLAQNSPADLDPAPELPQYFWMPAAMARQYGLKPKRGAKMVQYDLTTKTLTGKTA